MFRLGKHFILSAFLIATSLPCLASGKMSVKDVLAIEKNIALPRGAYPLTQYDRYYFVKDMTGLKKLIGYYLYEKNKKTDIHWIEPNSFPLMADGGCRVVHIEYDLMNKKLLKVWCNGEA